MKALKLEKSLLSFIDTQNTQHFPGQYNTVHLPKNHDSILGEINDFQKD